MPEAAADESMEVDTSLREDPEDFEIDTLPEITIPAPLPVAPCGNDEQGRLIISHITNINFKSYAGTRVLGPFQKSFTCIVGPNGSGKSNVIDAMLFVFGFRANKIRSKKLSVLIHNSDRHQNIQSCTVKVHFKRIRDTGDGDDDFEDVPNTEFTVSRTAHRNNSSDYYINDKKSTAKQVIQLLLSHGIDLDHNRFLILQGEVELISMMKPKAPNEHEEGMLEYLEDIIGSNRFKQPIDILNKRVDKITELRSEKLSRVKLAEKDKNALEGPKNEAIKFLSVENEINVKKNSIYQKYRFDAEKNLMIAEEKMGVVKKANEEIETKMSEIEKEKKEHQKHNKTVVRKFESLKEQVEEKKSKYADIEQKQTKIEEDLKHLAPKVKKLTKNLETEEKKLEELRDAPERHAREIEELQEDQQDLLDRKQRAEKELGTAMESIKSETKDLQVQKEKLEEQLLKHQGELNQKRSRSETTKAELDVALSSYQNEKSALDRMITSHSQAIKGIQERDSTIKDIKVQLPKKTAELNEVSEELNKTKTQEEDLSSKLNTLNMKIKDYSASLQNSRSQSAQLQGLMDQKNSGKIPGIVGRLGDLGGIDDKYDIAISTACGPLDNIVVDTLQTGQACIQYLKRANLGVCTFILLEKMNEWGEKSKRPFKSPENTPRLFDLIQYKDKRLTGAFYYAIRDTLVAADLNSASRIAFGKQRFRVVTLAGQLIETSGAMSGGGRPSKGRMGSAVVDSNITPEKLREMEEKLAAGREKRCSQIAQCTKLANRKEQLVKEVDDMKHTLETSTLELRMYQDQTKRLKSEIKDQEAIVKKSQPDPKLIQKLEDAFHKNNTEYELIKDKTSGIEAESQALHKKIVSISENKMKSAQANVDKASKDYEQNKVKINKLNVAIKSNSRNLTRAEDKVRSLTDELEECLKRQKDIEDKELNELKQRGESMLEEYNQLVEQCKEADTEVKKMAVVIEEMEKKQNELKGSVLESKRDLDKYLATVKECQGKRNHWQRELDKLKLHKLPEQAKEITLNILSQEELEECDVKTIQYEITVLEEQLNKMKPNMNVIEEYRRKENQYIERVGELDHVTTIRNQQRSLLDEMKKQRLQEFMAGFSLITAKLKEMYQMITLGGDAELELVDTLDPFSEGIVFSVRPPKKSWKNISNLSGGEKTLSSLSLVFALHHYKPTPLYVMDEIDAALDFKNVSIVANYIKERTKNAQFIIISLRDNMFEKASRLVGIYKTFDSTKTTVVSYREECYSAPPLTQ